MLFLLIVAVFVANISVAISQAIPYSYASGRDVAAVEARYARYTEARARNAGSEELSEICGRVDPYASKCENKIGRPKDSESLACDSDCCLKGFKVGNCGGSFGGIKLDFKKIATNLESSSGPLGTVLAVQGGIEPPIVTKCHCSNEPATVRCGRDNAFLGISCPIDNSACWRRCCRRGWAGGRCGGFLDFKCKCY